MTLTFRKIDEARQFLRQDGFEWAGFGILTKAEMYKAQSGLVASLKRVPFGGVQVNIG